MTKNAVAAPGLPIYQGQNGPPGPPQGMIVPARELMFLTGHVAEDADGNIVVGDFEAQLDAAFANVGRTLAAAGLDFSAVVKFNYYVVNFEPGMLAVLRKVRARYVSSSAPPASTFIAVAALYDPTLVVEIDGVVNAGDRQ